MIVITSLSALLALDQIPDLSWMTQAEHITLTSALIIAVIILWRSNDKKDNLIISQTKTITTSMDSITMSNLELRKIVEESVQTKRELTNVIEKLILRIEQLPFTSLHESIDDIRDTKEFKVRRST